MESVTIAYFSNIQEKIKELILKSQSSIKVAVAWFTNKELLGLLKEKAESNLKVEIIVSDDKINKIFKQETIAFKNAGGLISIYPTDSGKFLHDKFSIFDDADVTMVREEFRSCSLK